jgi:flagellar biosynthetic protein FliR
MDGLTPADAALIAHLPALAFAFVLLICRAGAACMLIPGTGEAEVPAMVRAGFAVALCGLLLPVLAPLMPRPPDDVGPLCYMVAAELLTGLFLGYLARLVVSAPPLAGQIIAAVTGQSSVLQPDTLLGPQGAALGRLLGLAAIVLVFVTGLQALPLAAIAGSYSVIPAGRLLPAADTASEAVTAVGALFALAVRLASPFVLAGVIWHVALALLSRLVPQLQVFFLAVPAQLAGGLALVGLLGAALLAAWQDAATPALGMLPGLGGVGLP